MFNPQQRDQRLARAEIQAAPDADFLIRHVTEDLMERLSAISRTFENGLALFARSPVLAHAMANTPQI